MTEQEFLYRNIENEKEIINELTMKTELVRKELSSLEEENDKLKNEMILKQNEFFFRPEEAPEIAQIEYVTKNIMEKESEQKHLEDELLLHRENLKHFETICGLLYQVNDKKIEKNVKNNTELKLSDFINQSDNHLKEDSIITEKEKDKKIIDSEKKSNSSMNENEVEKKVQLKTKLSGINANISFAKKICQSDSRRCRLELEKASSAIDKLIRSISY